MPIHFLLFALFILLTAAAPQAQTDAPLEGTVTYEVVTQVTSANHIYIGPRSGEVLSSLPRESKSTTRLRFHGSEAISERVARETAEPSSTTITLHASTVYYADRAAGRRVTQHQSPLEGTHLVEEPIEPIEWQITGEESEFLGYPMLRATAVVYDKEVEAWFTPAFPLPHGPDTYGGLPGLILVLTIADGQRTYQATSVEIEPLEEPVAPPTEGRTVSAEEYDRIVKERLEAARRWAEEMAEDDF